MPCSKKDGALSHLQGGPSLNKDDDCEARFEEFVYGGKERTKREMLDFADRSGFLKKKKKTLARQDQRPTGGTRGQG